MTQIQTFGTTTMPMISRRRPDRPRRDPAARMADQRHERRPGYIIMQTVAEQAAGTPAGKH